MLTYTSFLWKHLRRRHVIVLALLFSLLLPGVSTLYSLWVSYSLSDSSNPSLTQSESASISDKILHEALYQKYASYAYGSGPREADGVQPSVMQLEKAASTNDLHAYTEAYLRPGNKPEAGSDVGSRTHSETRSDVSVQIDDRRSSSANQDSQQLAPKGVSPKTTKQAQTQEWYQRIADQGFTLYPSEQTYPGLIAIIWSQFNNWCNSYVFAAVCIILNLIVMTQERGVKPYLPPAVLPISSHTILFARVITAVLLTCMCIAASWLIPFIIQSALFGVGPLTYPLPYLCMGSIVYLPACGALAFQAGCVIMVALLISCTLQMIGGYISTALSLLVGGIFILISKLNDYAYLQDLLKPFQWLPLRQIKPAGIHEYGIELMGWVALMLVVLIVVHLIISAIKPSLWRVS